MAETNSITVKKCAKCKSVLALSNFNKNKSKPDGLGTECRPCANAHSKKYHSENLEAHKERVKAYRDADPQRKYESDKRWRQANKDKCNAKNAAARAANPERDRAYKKKSWYKHHEKNLERKRVYRKKTPELQLVFVRNRQTRQKNAMPDWANIEAIKAIYRQSGWASRISGVKHHVDHYYPLKSDIVCGLHNEFNLRIVPAYVNLSKGNSFPTEE